MATAELPADGELRLGAVVLPPGRRVIPDDDEPVAWVTLTAVRNPGQVWSALADMTPQTGLVPVLLDDDPDADGEDFFFYDPVDPRLIDMVDPAQLLAERWHDPAEEEDLTPMPRFIGRRTNEFLSLKGPVKVPTRSPTSFSRSPDWPPTPTATRNWSASTGWTARRRAGHPRLMRHRPSKLGSRGRSRVSRRPFKTG
jgi:hypothetical protein